MDKVQGKEIPIEKQRDMLVEMNALKLPLLYQNLIAVYGEEKGRAIYDDLFEAGFKKRSKQFEGKDIGDIMMYEIDMFPATGWKIWIERSGRKRGAGMVRASGALPASGCNQKAQTA